MFGVASGKSSEQGGDLPGICALSQGPEWCSSPFFQVFSDRSGKAPMELEQQFAFGQFASRDLGPVRGAPGEEFGPKT